MNNEGKWMFKLLGGIACLIIGALLLNHGIREIVRVYNSFNHLLPPDLLRNQMSPYITPIIFGAIFFIAGVICLIIGIRDLKDERYEKNRKLLVDTEEAKWRGLSVEQYRTNEEKRIALERKQRYEQMLHEQEEQRKRDEEEAKNPLTECDVCSQVIAKTAEACPHCGAKRAKRCPKCMSDDISRLTGVDKGISAAAFGVFAANTVLNNYQCNDCREKFS